MKNVKKSVTSVILLLLGIVLVCVLIFVGIYFTRFCTISTIQQLSDYEDGYNLYTMEVKYDYDIDSIIDSDLNTDQDFFDAVIKESLLILPVKIKAPTFGCTAFQLTDMDGTAYMGRNYDFKKNTSAMLVYCTPKDGYQSVAFAALDNVSANNPTANIKKELATLTAPFICLDGMNEKGVSIAVLVVDSEPVHQDTEKQNIYTTLAIRLVLDRAASTEEAVDLLRSYDMLASSGKDYHFYINDATGNGQVVEWDCDSATRELVATPVEAVTNFYTIYADRVLPNQRNGIYGHGKERYDAVMQVFEEQKANHTVVTAWDALKAASQSPNSEEITSNTQWSIVYDNTDLTAEVVIRRNWDDVYEYSLMDNHIEKR